MARYWKSKRNITQEILNSPRHQFTSKKNLVGDQRTCHYHLFKCLSSSFMQVPFRNVSWAAGVCCVEKKSMGQSNVTRRVETALHKLSISITRNVIGGICSDCQRRCTTAKWRSLDHVVERRYVRARDAQQPSSDAAAPTYPRNCKVYFDNVAGRCLSSGLIARAR
jgi:hypothetical protein